MVRVRLQLRQCDHSFQSAFQPYFEGEPARRLLAAGGIEMRVPAVECARVGIGSAYHPHDRDDARHLATGVIEEGLIALADLVADEVTRLVVAYALPAGGLARRSCGVIDAEGRGFSLEEPMLHCPRSYQAAALNFDMPASVTSASNGTSWLLRAISGTSWHLKAMPISSGRCQLWRWRR